jgi:hypothetical protein
MELVELGYGSIRGNVTLLRGVEALKIAPAIEHL